jgi:hypothetical protein
MALYTELTVERDTYKLVLEIFVSTKNFPKEYKYSLGRDMERDVLVLIHCIPRYRRAGVKDYKRRTYLGRLSEPNNSLKPLY